MELMNVLELICILLIRILRPHMFITTVYKTWTTLA